MGYDAFYGALFVILERDSPDPHANELYIDFWVCCAFKNIDLQPTIYIVRPE